MSDATSAGRALRLTAGQRTGIGILAVLLLGTPIGIIVWYATVGKQLPDFFLGVLAVGSMIAALLLIVGRLPRVFAFGVELDVAGDPLYELISIIKSSGLDEAQESSMLKHIKSMVNPPSAYKTAINRLEAEKRSSHSEPQAARSEETSTPSESGDYPFSSLEQALKDAVPGASVTERESVRTGRPGKPPIYAFMIEVDGKRIMVDVEDYWSDSVVQLREKKTLTTLTKGTDADAVVVLVPTDGLDRYEKALGQISGTEVLDIDDVKAGRFGDLREFVDNEVLKDPKTQ